MNGGCARFDKYRDPRYGEGSSTADATAPQRRKDSKVSTSKRLFEPALLLVTCTALALGAGCAPKSKSFKLAGPTAAKHVLVAPIHVVPDGEFVEQAEAAFIATAEYLAEGIAAALRDQYGQSGITAELREAPEGLPFIYQRRLIKAKPAEDWRTFFQSGNYSGTLTADPDVPKMAVPFPVVEFPDDWKSDAEAALFVFVHFAALSGPPPTELIEDVPEDYNYVSVVGYVLIDTAEGKYLGSGHRTEAFDLDQGVSEEAVAAVAAALGAPADAAAEEEPAAEDAEAAPVEVPTADAEDAAEATGSPLAVDGTAKLPGYLFPGREVMSQVVLTTLMAQIDAIAGEIGLQLTLTE